MKRLLTFAMTAFAGAILVGVATTTYAEAAQRPAEISGTPRISTSPCDTATPATGDTIRAAYFTAAYQRPIMIGMPTSTCEDDQNNVNGTPVAAV